MYDFWLQNIRTAYKKKRLNSLFKEILLLRSKDRDYIIENLSSFQISSILTSLPRRERSLIIQTIPAFRNIIRKKKTKKKLITNVAKNITNEIPLKLQKRIKIHPFQIIIKKMMHSFGDNMIPLTFSSIVIGDHIKSWLNSWFKGKSNWNLFELKNMFPKEYEIWYRC